MEQIKNSVLITHKEVIGYMALWAIRQHPSGRPEGLFDVTDTITTAAQDWPEGVPSLRMFYVDCWQDIENWLEKTLKDHPVLAQWNTPRNGHTTQTLPLSLYFSPQAEHDFIDIDALLRNVALSVWRDAQDEER